MNMKPRKTGSASGGKSEISNQEVLGAVEDLSTTVSEFADNVQNNFRAIDARLDNLEDGQERILLRLDNVAYRFEIKDLDRRVSLLESKS